MPPLIAIHHPAQPPDPTRPVYDIHADRWQLAKLRWRTKATDGTEFGLDLHQPLKHHDYVYVTESSAYRIKQTEESVLIIRVQNLREAGELAWNIGNLHQPVEVTDDALITADDPAVRQMLEKKEISFTSGQHVFQPVRAQGGHTHHHG